MWVLPDGESTGAQAHVVATPPPALERAPSDLPSRTADNFFWLGRYTERLEQIVRVSRYVLRCLADDSSMVRQGRVGPLEKVLARLGLVSKLATSEGSHEPLEKEILLLLFQEDRTPGVRNLLKRIHLAAFSVRDRLSADTWRLLNRLEPDARQRPGRLTLVQAAGVLHTLVLDLAAFSGMEMENMTRGHGWAFLDLGRRLERGTFIAKLMEAVFSSGPNLDLLLEPALEIGDSVMTHRRRYFTEPRLASTMEVLVIDAGNPRSLAFQIASLRNHAAALPRGANPEGVAAVQRRVNQLDAQLQSLAVATVACEATDAVGRSVLLTSFAAGLAELSELLTQVYFSHVTPQVN